MAVAQQVQQRPVGDLLREWRERRRRSQLDLALDTEISTRHLSFVETGRSKPSRELVLHLAEHLDVPLRERNALLLAAGYAPAYPERSLEDEAMAPVRDAVDQILTGHEPFPAIVVDQRWDLVAANTPAMAAMTAGVDPALLAAPVNTLRLCVHPDGLAPRIVNFAQYSGHLLTRLARQALFTQDAGLHELLEELRGYPGVPAPSPHLEPDELVFVPLRLRDPSGVELSFFSTLATFGTALDVTLSELMIEAFFPADKATEAALRAHAG